MGWANVRQTVVVEAGRDPRESIVLGLGRAILRRTQGMGLHVYHGADGSPETSYGGSYAPQVQAQIVGAAMGIATPDLIRDMGGADIATGVTEEASGASRQFAERLRRGRSVV
ncbi:hypothetical protein JOE61_003859 [Nocardioides salarius]|uniref:Uncharacterized protein n=1 Tax=Nocardioides salarius TaxID=374513 RepID=A0ABS2MFV6_9ACTN|nr:hypothetical protein [Nocardioides salarius]MBM7510045.1 hypothetical protein [Nocardioides salarius]